MDSDEGQPGAAAIAPSGTLRRPPGRPSRASAKATAVPLAAVLILSGFALAIGNGSTPEYHVSSLALSGSFFALASSGNTLYAASDNGGSVLLQKSSDRGVDWSANPVPYSAVAGGAPWQYAAVAVEGNDVVLTAATGGSAVGYPVYPSYPPVTPFQLSAGPCGTNSTLLVASSTDGGSSWNTSTWVTGNLSVTSLQAGIEGSTAAVAWLGETTNCSAQIGRVGAISSHDGGRSWLPPQPLGSPSLSITTGEALEMAPEENGLLVGFASASVATGSSLLDLWQLPDTGAGGFAEISSIPAPASWTLQGDPGTPAYLLTPTYLIPLTSFPYTAIPFNQLQSDGGGIGVLPRVVGLAATGAGVVEVAATTADNLGVDCWQFDTVHDRVSQSCHVAVGSAFLPSAPALPIVALIDGGGWWTAIGASGDGCDPSCGPFGGPVPGAPTAGSASVGTSVCFTGCASAQGLDAYSFTPGSSTGRSALDAVAALLAGIGALMLAVVVLSNPRRTGTGRVPVRDAAPPVDDRAPEDAPLRTVRRVYLAGLAAWVLVWLPLAILTFLPGQPPAPASLELAVVVGGVVGTLVTSPLHHVLRARLLQTQGIGAEQLFGASAGGRIGGDGERVRTTSYLAYASWAAGIAVLVSFWSTLTGASATGVFIGGGPNTMGPSPTEAALGVSVVAFAALRTLYHVGLHGSVAATEGPGPRGAATPEARSGQLRTWLGAMLLPWNPLLGLFIGVALQSSLSWSPYFLAWAFLPVTLLGIALLGGCFGRTRWSSELLSADMRSGTAV